MKAATTVGTHLFGGPDMTAPEAWSLGDGAVAVFSIGRDSDTTNEDAAVVVEAADGWCLLAVADGMGALPAGREASKLALEQLARTVTESEVATDHRREAILDGFDAANRAVIELGIGAGTTLAAVEIRGRHIRSYHVGDSPVMVVGQRGKLKYITLAHSPVGYAVEAGMLDEDEALAHEDRHVISNMIGSPEMKIEMGPVLELAPLDTLLVASDGLFDNLRLEEIVQAIRKGPIDALVAATAENCRKRMANPDGDPPGKPDDLTIVVYRGVQRAH